VNVIRKLRSFFRMGTPQPPEAGTDFIEIHSHSMPILYRHHARARKYVLRLYANKTVVVTVPRAGSMSFARKFVESRKNWLEKQWLVLETRNVPAQLLRPGMKILFRGQPVVLSVQPSGTDWRLQFGGETAPLAGMDGNLRPALEGHLRKLAKTELVPRALELAGTPQLGIKRVAIRNQRSRWGSCSHSGTISLNWRLIQLPSEVRDYIILHELMHLRQLNHSPRFWAEVEKACPAYRMAENWLKQNSSQVGF